MNKPERIEMKGRFVMDRDGDVWQLWQRKWRCLTTESTDQYGGDLLNVCGPLTDLEPAAVLIGLWDQPEEQK